MIWCTKAVCVVHRSEALSRDGQRVSLRTVSRVTLKVWLRSVDHGARLDLFFLKAVLRRTNKKVVPETFQEIGGWQNMTCFSECFVRNRKVVKRYCGIVSSGNKTQLCNFSSKEEFFHRVYHEDYRRTHPIQKFLCCNGRLFATSSHRCAPHQGGVADVRLP